FPGLVTEVNTGLLDQLRAIVATYAPSQQAAQMVTVSLPPPQNSSGEQMSGSGSSSQLAPLTMTFMAAATDPYLNLALGFGTAYPFDAQQSDATIAELRADFMVTAHWEHGLDGASAPLDYAAIIPAPGAALPLPPPANMRSEALGTLRPLATDG